MAIRISTYNSPSPLTLDSVLAGMRNDAIAERLDAMGAWEYLFNVDPKGLGREGLRSLAGRMFSDIEPGARPAFLEAFRGDLKTFENFLEDYRSESVRAAVAARQERRERRRESRPRRFGKSGPSF